MTYKVTAVHKQQRTYKDQRNIGKNLLFFSKRKLFSRLLFYHLQKHSPRSKGQVTVELILLGVVLIVLSQLVVNQIKTNNYIKDFAKGPSQVVANMMANGNWKKNPDESKAEHPNIHERHYSWDP